MRFVYITISIIGLLLTLVPPMLLFAGSISEQLQKTLMLVGAFCWFLTAPAWMNKEALEV